MTDLSHSPLATLTIDEIFAVDPLTLTDADRLAAISELRRRRCEFAASEAATKAAGKKAKPKSEPKPAAESAKLDKPPSQTTLDDLLGD